jgi:alkanesulfonate monooxygenase SsuD/methylene tetrahydromethanopterin reductase-like flavin-dependent oxidoreductase (luciferase family)
VLFGAFKPAALARVARWGDGLLCAAPPSWAGRLFQTVEESWRQAGRSGRPRLVAQVNVAIGPQETIDDARRALVAYYGTTDMADRMLTMPGQIRDTLAGFADLGADETMLYCWSGDPDQVDRLADATG